MPATAPRLSWSERIEALDNVIAVHEEVSLSTAISDLGITAKVTPLGEMPWGEDEHDRRAADYWRVTLRHPGGKRMTVRFHTGIGLRPKAPTAEDVLSCVLDDAGGYENADDFEDWADEYGYSTDSRKAEKDYEATRRQSMRLKAWLGDDLYQTLIWHTTRN